MSTITRERAAGIANGEKCYTHDDVVELARIALASLEAEAVHQFIYNNPYEEGYTEWLDCNKDYFNGVPEDCRRILYTAPPVPVSVPDELTREEYKRRFMEEDDFDATFRGGWNAAIARFKEMNKCL